MTEDLVDPKLVSTISSGKFDLETIIKATAGYNPIWTDAYSTVIYNPSPSASPSDRSRTKAVQKTESEGFEISKLLLLIPIVAEVALIFQAAAALPFPSLSDNRTKAVQKTESEKSKRSLDFSLTQPESGADKSLPGPSRSTESVQKTAEASSGNFESLLQEVEKIGISKNLGLKMFCNVPFQESNDQMIKYISIITFTEKRNALAQT